MKDLEKIIDRLRKKAATEICKDDPSPFADPYRIRVELESGFDSISGRAESAMELMNKWMPEEMKKLCKKYNMPEEAIIAKVELLGDD